MTANAKNYRIELLTKTDDKNTLKFLRNHFFKDEPLCQFLGLESSADNPNKELDEFSLDGYDNGWGFKAVNQDGEMIGLCLNTVIERGVGDDYHVSPENKFSFIKDLLDFLMLKTDIWANNPDFKKGVQMNILSVDKKYGGQGIGTELTKRLGQNAKDQGLDFIVVECSSHFSGLVMKKLGFKEIYSLPYDEYKPNGKIVLRPQAPHLTASVWVDKL